MPRRGRSPVSRSESTRDRSPSPPTVSIDDQSHTEVLTLGRLQRNNKGKSESGLDVDGSCHNAANKNIVVIKTKLQLVDLAGSECVGKKINLHFKLTLMPFENAIKKPFR